MATEGRTINAGVMQRGEDDPSKARTPAGRRTGSLRKTRIDPRRQVRATTRR